MKVITNNLLIVGSENIKNFNDEQTKHVFPVSINFRERETFYDTNEKPDGVYTCSKRKETMANMQPFSNFWTLPRRRYSSIPCYETTR